jgi:acetyl/propionyl-CoA carboxylase alpha subunit/acetyl-CoA carboxylase carboxyltransferase component
MSKNFKKLLIANRGEIAIRIAQAARERSLATLAVFPEDDADCLHLNYADEVVQLAGVGAAAYLDIEQIINVAVDNGCDVVHPGYGFLSENAEFAARCADAGITFVGPDRTLLELFGNKVRAREAAEKSAVPVLPASQVIANTDQARGFMDELGQAVIIKAVAGGGGRGMRIVEDAAELEEALGRCASEAAAAFGSGDLYLESYLREARHIEVQIAGDGTGAVVHFGERDCSIQRRHQKVVEMAPSPNLATGLRDAIHQAALSIAGDMNYQNLGTFEFLVDGKSPGDDARFYFMEANPRIQVEHTVTEEVMGVDLVSLQLDLAQGNSLNDLGLAQSSIADPVGYAIQMRVNMETLTADGGAMPSGGTLDVFETPRGPGVRVDTHGYGQYRTSPHYDSLLAKLIVHGREYSATLARATRALTEFSVAGVATNLAFLRNVVMHPDVASGSLHTGFVAENLEVLTLYPAEVDRLPGQRDLAGGQVDSADPLAVLNFRKDGFRKDQAPAAPVAEEYEDGVHPVVAVMQSTIVSLEVKVGDLVREGDELLVLNAMKMEHVLNAEVSGVVQQVNIGVADTIAQGSVLLVIGEQEVAGEAQSELADLELDIPRPDLAEVLRRRALTTDEGGARVAKVKKRHEAGERTAMENVLDLVDEGSFMQYGSMAVASGLRGTLDERLAYAPADGLVMGLCHINGDQFDESMSRCVAVAYDYTVLAGTQGGMNHKMMDRMFSTADKLDSPLVLFSEGGGGRAGSGSMAARPGKGGDPGLSGGGGLHTSSWNLLGQLNGRVPVVGINSGYCFAGNVVLLGMCDVIIATENSSLGIGGPAMIEGGGLGVYQPEEVGPMSIQVPNGVVDIAVKDEAEAVQAAKKYLSYFQGDLEQWSCADQRELRHAIPENRLRVYDIRKLLATMADTDSVLELRPEFGKAMITAFIRIEGRPVGVVGNDPQFLSGAVDADAADKAARFMTLCDGFNIPLLLLCDTPGIMVGPEDEKTAVIRHAARLFVVGASLTVPTFMVVLRKAYGLGAQAMAGGCHSQPGFLVAWPTSEFGGMGLEGQVKLGQRALLEQVEDLEERQQLYERMVEGAYNRGKGLNAAHVFEIDDLIDPADTRKWLMAGLKASPRAPSFPSSKRAMIDVW